MLTILLLIIALAAPFVILIHGKRFLGDQTHPAALFILSWMASALTIGSVMPPGVPSGPTALVWVVICFTVVAAVRKLKQRSGSVSDLGDDKKSP
jgi:hypothetical protein